MKNLWLFVIPLFVLGCDEELIEKIIEKRVRYDSIVYRDRPVIVIDTVLLEVIKTETDTVYKVRVDSIFVYDTIVEHHYGDTLWIFFMQDVYVVPEELQPIVTSFGLDAQRYGFNPPGGPLVIAFVPAEQLPGAGWSSHTYTTQWQWFIDLRDDIPTRYLYSSIYREMAVNQLGFKYTNDGGPMDPRFDPYSISFEAGGDEKESYLGWLFDEEGN